MRILCIGFLAGIAALSAAGCTRCADGEEVTESSIRKGSRKLLWEQVSLGAKEEVFVKELATLSAIPPGDVPGLIRCGDQFSVNVIDPLQNTISERIAGARTLLGCTLLQAGVYRTWTLLSVQAILLNGKVGSVAFHFAPSAFSSLQKELEARFGPGEKRTLKEISLLGETPVDTWLWLVEGTFWALQIDSETSPERVVLTHQLSDSLRTLPAPSAASAPGEKVSLDDLGITGEVNLYDIPSEDSPDGEPSGKDTETSTQ